MADRRRSKTPLGKLTTTIFTETNVMAPDGSQITSYEILDGFLRTRQTQAR